MYFFLASSLILCTISLLCTCWSTNFKMRKYYRSCDVIWYVSEQHRGSQISRRNLNFSEASETVQRGHSGGSIRLMYDFCLLYLSAMLFSKKNCPPGKAVLNKQSASIPAIWVTLWTTHIYLSITLNRSLSLSHMPIACSPQVFGAPARHRGSQL